MLKLRVALFLIALPALFSSSVFADDFSYGSRNSDSGRIRSYGYSNQIKPEPLGGYSQTLGGPGAPKVYDSFGRQKGTLSTNPYYPSYPSDSKDFYSPSESKNRGLLAPQQRLYIIPGH
jgi:hypothetical protein